MTLTAIVIHGNNSDDFQAHMAKESEGENASSTQAERLLHSPPSDRLLFSRYLLKGERTTDRKANQNTDKVRGKGLGGCSNITQIKEENSQHWKNGKFSFIAGWKEREVKWPLMPSWLLGCEFRTNAFNMAITKAKCKQLNQCNQKAMKYLKKYPVF